MNDATPYVDRVHREDGLCLGCSAPDYAKLDACPSSKCGDVPLDGNRQRLCPCRLPSQLPSSFAGAVTRPTAGQDPGRSTPNQGVGAGLVSCGAEVEQSSLGTDLAPGEWQGATARGFRGLT